VQPLPPERLDVEGPGRLALAPFSARMRCRYAQLIRAGRQADVLDGMLATTFDPAGVQARKPGAVEDAFGHQVTETHVVHAQADAARQCGVSIQRGLWQWLAVHGNALDDRRWRDSSTQMR